MKRGRILFLNLDDTVIYGRTLSGRFVNAPEDVKIIPAALKKMKEYAKAGWFIVGVANQRVAMEYAERQREEACTAEMARQSEGLFDQIMVCRHHPNAADQENRNCYCRKPKPGMLVLGAYLIEQANNVYCPPNSSMMVGDRYEDEGAAENAGVKFVKTKDWWVKSVWNPDAEETQIETVH